MQPPQVYYEEARIERVEKCRSVALLHNADDAESAAEAGGQIDGDRQQVAPSGIELCKTQLLGPVRPSRN